MLHACDQRFELNKALMRYQIVFCVQTRTVVKSSLYTSAFFSSDFFLFWLV